MQPVLPRMDRVSLTSTAFSGSSGGKRASKSKVKLFCMNKLYGIEDVVALRCPLARGLAARSPGDRCIREKVRQ